MDEDESSEPKKDSRLQLAKFNLEMKPLYELLHHAESIRLATYLLEPEAVEIESLLKNGEKKSVKPRLPGEGTNGDKWSGGKWANDNVGGFRLENQEVKISIGDEREGNNKQPVGCIY